MCIHTREYICRELTERQNVRVSTQGKNVKVKVAMLKISRQLVFFFLLFVSNSYFPYYILGSSPYLPKNLNDKTTIINKA